MGRGFLAGFILGVLAGRIMSPRTKARAVPMGAASTVVKELKIRRYYERESAYRRAVAEGGIRGYYDAVSGGRVAYFPALDWVQCIDCGAKLGQPAHPSQGDALAQSLAQFHRVCNGVNSDGHDQAGLYRGTSAQWVTSSKEWGKSKDDA